MLYQNGNLFVFSPENGASNICAYELQDEVIIFDSSLYPKKFDDVCDIMETRTSKRVKKVFITHYHPDHCFGALFSKRRVETFMNLKTFEILTSLDKEFIRNLSNSAGNDFTNFIPTIQRKKIEIFNKNLIKTFENNILTGTGIKGHTEDSTIYILKPDNILISGDIVFSGVHSELGEANLKGWIEDLESLKNMKIDYVVPGHGIPMEGKKLIADQIDYLNDYITKNNFDRKYSKYLLHDLIN